MTIGHFTKITASEMKRMFHRPRTYIGFAAFVFFDLLFLFFFTRPGFQRYISGLLEGSGYAFESYFSGLTLGYLIVAGTTFLMGAIFLSLVAGDVVAKDNEDGNLRLILSRPISRFSLLLSKFTATQIYTLLFFVFVGVSSYFTGAFARGWTGGMFVYARELDLFNVFSFGEGLWRYGSALLFLGLTMTTISSVAFLFSCLPIKPAAATIITVCLFFIDFISANLPYTQDYLEWFVTPRMRSWVGIYRDPIPWAEMIQNYTFLFGLSISCFILGWLNFEQRDLKA